MILRICGIDELDYYCDEEVTHLVTVLARDSELHPERPDFLPEENHLWLQFSDTDSAADEDAPTYHHVDRLIQWLDQFEAIDGLLVHCAAGVSRSPAIACIALAYLEPELGYNVVMDAVERSAASDLIWPNDLVISLGDEILGAEGELIYAVQRWKQKRNSPETDDG